MLCVNFSNRLYQITTRWFRNKYYYTLQTSTTLNSVEFGGLFDLNGHFEGFDEFPEIHGIYITNAPLCTRKAPVIVQ